MTHLPTLALLPGRHLLVTVVLYLTIVALVVFIVDR